MKHDSLDNLGVEVHDQDHGHDVVVDESVETVAQPVPVRGVVVVVASDEESICIEIHL